MRCRKAIKCGRAYVVGYYVFDGSRSAFKPDLTVLRNLYMRMCVVRSACTNGVNSKVSRASINHFEEMLLPMLAEVPIPRD